MDTAPNAASLNRTVILDYFCLASAVKTAVLAARSGVGDVYYFNGCRTNGLYAGLLRLMIHGRIAEIDFPEYGSAEPGNTCFHENVVERLWDTWPALAEAVGVDEAARHLHSRLGFDPKITNQEIFERAFRQNIRHLEAAVLAEREFPGKADLVLRRTPFLAGLRRSFPALAIIDYRLRFSIRPVLRQRYFYDMGAERELAVSPLRHLVRFVVSAASGLLSSGLRSLLGAVRPGRLPPADGRSRIAVQFAGSTYVPRGMSELFWWHESEIRPEDVLIVFQHDFDERYRRLLLEDGFAIGRWSKSPAVLIGEFLNRRHHERPNLILAPSLRVTVGALAASFRYLLTGEAGRLGLWGRVRLADYVFRALVHHGFYRQSGIKILWNMQEHEFNRLAQLQAMALSGGLKMSARISYQAFLDGDLCNAEDVLFAWGNDPAELDENHFPSRRIYITGYPMDDGFADGSKLTRQLTAEYDGQVRIAYMDQTLWRDTSISLETHRAMWRVLVAVADARPQVVILFKAKKPHIAIDEVRLISPEAERYFASGRFVMVTGERPDGRARAREVAHASHLVVGLGFNTAAIESALAGVPTLLFHPGRIRTGRFAREGVGTTVFTDEVALRRAIIDYVDERRLPDQARYDALYRTVDPYQDGRTHRRVGEVIGWYFDELKAGTDRGDVHEIVSARWAKSPWTAETKASRAS